MHLQWGHYLGVLASLTLTNGIVQFNRFCNFFFYFILGSFWWCGARKQFLSSGKESA